MITTTRPTLLLEKEVRVWVLGIYRKGTVRAHNFGTGKYMVQLDYWEGQRLCEKYVYRGRDQLIKCGG